MYICVSVWDGGRFGVLKGKEVGNGSVRWWGMITGTKGGETDGRDRGEGR